jgi:hypothetical protein
MSYRFFMDLVPDKNVQDGLPYCAAGIVNSEDDRGCCVSFLDPWGDPQTEFRGASEIKITYVSKKNFMKLKEAIENG